MHSHNNLCPCTVLAWNEDGLRKRMMMHAEILVPFPRLFCLRAGIMNSALSIMAQIQAPQAFNFCR